MKNESKEKQENIEREGKRELLKPKNDVVFQSLFNQKNETITKNMISALLGEEIIKIKINETKELYREYPEEKLGILDLEAQINEKEKIDIEIQLIDRKNLTERLLKYFSKIYGMQVEKGKDYKEAKRVVIIAIIDYKYELTKELKQMETIWNLREKLNPKLILTDKIEIRIIELKKVQEEYKRDKTNKKAQWMLFINNPNDKEVQELVEKNEEIKEATIEVEKMSEDEKMQRLAFLREKAILDEKDIYRAGIDKGEKNGRLEEKIEIAKELLKIGMPIDQIVQATKLSKEKIEKISKE